MLKFVFINTFVGENPGGVIAEQLKDAGLLDEGLCREFPVTVEIGLFQP